MKTNIMTIKQHVAENKRLLSLSGKCIRPFMNMSRHDDRHVLCEPSSGNKNVMDKSNVLGDVKIISEEWKKYYSITFVHWVDTAITNRIRQKT